MPLLTALSLEFKEYRNKIRIEIPHDSIHGQGMPIEFFEEKLSSEILSCQLSSLDFDKSYIGLNWIYLMNLRSKIQHIKFPSMLVYY